MECIMALARSFELIQLENNAFRLMINNISHESLGELKHIFLQQTIAEVYVNCIVPDEFTSHVVELLGTHDYISLIEVANNQEALIAPIIKKCENIHLENFLAKISAGHFDLLNSNEFLLNFSPEERIEMDSLLKSAIQQTNKLTTVQTQTDDGLLAFETNTLLFNQLVQKKSELLSPQNRNKLIDQLLLFGKTDSNDSTIQFDINGIAKITSPGAVPLIRGCFFKLTDKDERELMLIYILLAVMTENLESLNDHENTQAIPTLVEKYLSFLRNKIENRLKKLSQKYQNTYEYQLIFLKIKIMTISCYNLLHNSISDQVDENLNQAYLETQTIISYLNNSSADQENMLLANINIWDKYSALDTFLLSLANHDNVFDPSNSSAEKGTQLVSMILTPERCRSLPINRLIELMVLKAEFHYANIESEQAFECAHKTLVLLLETTANPNTLSNIRRSLEVLGVSNSIAKQFFHLLADQIAVSDIVYRLNKINTLVKKTHEKPLIECCRLMIQLLSKHVIAFAGTNEDFFAYLNNPKNLQRFKNILPENPVPSLKTLSFLNNLHQLNERVDKLENEKKRDADESGLRAVDETPKAKRTKIEDESASSFSMNATPTQGPT